jgi:hypothetical protein
MAQNGIGDGISKQSKPAPVPQSANVVRGKHARADTTGHSLPASLPQHPDIKLQVTPKERNKNYRHLLTLFFFGHRFHGLINVPEMRQVLAMKTGPNTWI